MLPVASYARSYAGQSQYAYLARSRSVPLLRNVWQLGVSAKSYNYKSVIVGAGSSANCFAADTSLRAKYLVDRYALFLNSYVFSGLPYDLCLFECPTARLYRSVFFDCFDAGHHLNSPKSSARIVLAGASLDSMDDYVSNHLGVPVFLLPQTSLSMPPKISRFAESQLSFLLQLHAVLHHAFIAPAGFAVRASLIRAIVLLALMGFREIELVGFDGGTGYFYDERSLWPGLERLREVQQASKDAPYIASIRKGVLRLDKNHSSRFHTTLDPSLGAYTLRELLPILSRALSIEFTSALNGANALL